MRQYNMLQAIVMSFYSRKLYQDVAINWGGKSFLYLLLILALTWIFPVYQIQHSLIEWVNELSDKIVSQIPVIKIKNGLLSTPENRPYLITDPDSHVTIAIIDTSGKYKNLKQTRTGVLVTQTEIISQPNPNEFKVNEIPKDLTATLEPKAIQQYSHDYIGYTWILIFIMVLLASFIYRIFESFLYAIVGKIFAVISNAPVHYSQIVQITMVALTPVIIIAAVVDAIGIKIQHEMLIYFMLAILYMFYGIIVNKKN